MAACKKSKHVSKVLRKNLQTPQQQKQWERAFKLKLLLYNFPAP